MHLPCPLQHAVLLAFSPLRQPKHIRESRCFLRALAFAHLVMSDRVSTITALMWVQKSPRDPTSWSRYRRGSATVTLCSERELPGKSNAERTLHCGPCLPGGSMHALASSLQWPPHRLHAALHDEADNIVSTGTGDHRLPSILTQRRACSSLVLLGGGGGRGPTQQQGVIYPLEERLLRSRSRRA